MSEVKCKMCKVPLTGVLGKIARVLFRVAPSAHDPELCNKCGPSEKKIRKTYGESGSEKDGKYKCQICQRMIHESKALAHVKAEEFILELIRKEHPQWRAQDFTCTECIEYYRRLIRETEI